MYNSDDPGASLATAKIAPSITGFAAEEYLRFRGSGPQENYTNGRIWLGSGQNVIIASRETKLGAIFCRVQVNKYALRLPCCGSSATIISPLTIHTSQGNGRVREPTGRYILAAAARLFTKTGLEDRLMPGSFGVNQ